MKISEGFLRECKIAYSDKRIFCLVSVLPICIFSFMIFLFGSGSVSNIPIGMVDYDNSYLSRGLGRYIDATSAIKVNNKYETLEKAKNELRSGAVYGLIIIPKNFETQIRTGNRPKILAYYNGQYMLAGKIVKSALAKSITTYAASAEAIKILSSGNKTIIQSLSSAVPIRIQATPIFNKNMDYAQFMLSALLPTLLQLIIVIAMVLSIAIEDKCAGFEHWLGRAGIKAIISKVIFYAVAFSANAFLMLALMYCVFGWQMHGDMSYLIISIIFMIFSSQSLGLIIYFLIPDGTKALSLAAAFCAPSMAYIGVTFPLASMSYFAKFWHTLFPVSHYVAIQISQSSGNDLNIFITEIIHLLLFPLVAVVIVNFRIQKQQFQRKA